MKILVFYVDKQYFNMVTLFLRLRVRRELIIRRDGRAVEGTGLENRRCESIRGFESHSLRQLNFSIDLRKYPRGRRGSPAKGVGRVKSVAEVQILSSAPRKARENIAFSLAFSLISSCFGDISFNIIFEELHLPQSCRPEIRRSKPEKARCIYEEHRYPRHPQHGARAGRDR